MNLQDFNADTVESFKIWVRGQFAEHYTPNPKRVDCFVLSVLRENVRHFDMPIDIDWNTLRDEWEPQETFNDCFLD